MDQALSIEKTALEPLVQQAAEYIQNSKADNTKRAYRSDWEQFEAWCSKHGLPSIPASPEAVALYITELASSHKPSSINRKLASISVAHQAKGFETPTHSMVVRGTLKGIRRALGVAPERKTPFRSTNLREVVRVISDDLQGIRDKALLLIGYAGAFRRSELVDLQMEDIVYGVYGLEITIRKSKTDQEGKGLIKRIGRGAREDTCPVHAFEDWIRAAGLTTGPVFRPINKHGHILPHALSSQSVALIVKKIADKAGLPVEAVAGHSLRAGFVTDAKDNGIIDQIIMKQTGHRTPAMIHNYYRGGDQEVYNTTAIIGL